MPIQAIAQVPGVTKRLPAEQFRTLLRTTTKLEVVLHRYTLAFLTQVAQSAACNRAHTLTERCARWLLMTHDRMASDDFPLTQDLLAIMLGVRRSGVSLAASTLQNAGLIQYTRGSITIRNRRGLEAAACECYRIVRRHLDRVLPDPVKRA